MIERCAAEGVNPGYPLGRDYPEHDDGLLVAITEQRSRADIDRLAEVLGAAVAAERTAAPPEGWAHERCAPRPRSSATARARSSRRSKPGRRAFVAPAARRARARRSTSCSRARLRRAEPPRLPEIAEPEIVRHYNRLSKRNFDLDTGFYPLGSCTMKHNPKLHERVAALPGHARLHPLQDPRRAQGALELMWNLQEALGEIAGLPHVSLQPSARARTASSPACCSPAPTTRTAASTRTQGAHARHRARHQPGDGDDGGLRGRQGRHRTPTAASTSTTCARRPTTTSPA